MKQEITVWSMRKQKLELKQSKGGGWERIWFLKELIPKASHKYPLCYLMYPFNPRTTGKKELLLKVLK